MGRFAIEWKEFAHGYIRSLPKNQRKKSHSDQSWVTQITKIIFNFTYDVWEERNTDRHGRDATEKEMILVERAVQQTIALYEIRHEVMPQHKDLFYDTLTQHQEVEKSSRSLQQWVTTWGPVLWDSLKKATTLGIGRESSIASCFTQSQEVERENNMENEMKN